MKDRPEDALILARMFITRFNAAHGGVYFLPPSAEGYLKAARFQRSVGELKTAVEGAIRIARREGGSQISVLHLSNVLDKRSAFSQKSRAEAHSASPGRPEDQKLRSRIKKFLDAVKLVKSELPQDERVATKMLDAHMGNNSGGKAAAAFMNRHHREIAAFIGDNLSEYQTIVPDIKRMCRKVSDELPQKGI